MYASLYVINNDGNNNNNHNNNNDNRNHNDDADDDSFKDLAEIFSWNDDKHSHNIRIQW